MKLRDLVLGVVLSMAGHSLFAQAFLRVQPLPSLPQSTPSSGEELKEDRVEVTKSNLPPAMQQLWNKMENIPVGKMLLFIMRRIPISTSFI